MEIKPNNEEIIERILNCMPENPYPQEVFPMTLEEYAKAIPEENLRSAISGCLARWAWNVAYEMILDRIRREFEW